jgi:hypothetical protein
VEALQSAVIDPPGGGFTPKDRTEEAVRFAVGGLIEMNWEEEARVILERREREGHTFVSGRLLIGLRRPRADQQRWTM